MEIKGRKSDKLFLGIISVMVIVVLVFVPFENNYVGVFLKQFSGVDWDKVTQRDTVENSIPITLIEQTGKNCIVSAENFDIIIDHKYFVRSADLANELNFDREHNTLTLNCDLLAGDKSRLDIWYVVEESVNHSMKYEYWITAWNNTQP
mgnify:CR=1 FL=1